MDTPYMNVTAVVILFITPHKMKAARTVAAASVLVDKVSMDISLAQQLAEKGKVTPMFTLCHLHRDTRDF